MAITITHGYKSVAIQGDRKSRLRLCPRTYHAYRFEYLIGEMQPNYPVPAIRHEIEIHDDRVILWCKMGSYWMFQYLASTIPTKILNRWAE